LSVGGQPNHAGLRAPTLWTSHGGGIEALTSDSSPGLPSAVLTLLGGSFSLIRLGLGGHAMRRARKRSLAVGLLLLSIAYSAIPFGATAADESGAALAKLVGTWRGRRTDTTQVAEVDLEVRWSSSHKVVSLTTSPTGSGSTLEEVLVISTAAPSTAADAYGGSRWNHARAKGTAAFEGDSVLVTISDSIAIERRCLRWWPERSEWTERREWADPSHHTFYRSRTVYRRRGPTDVHKLVPIR